MAANQNLQANIDFTQTGGDAVAKTIKQLNDEMRSNPAFAKAMAQELGVYSSAAEQAKIKAQAYADALRNSAAAGNTAQVKQYSEAIRDAGNSAQKSISSHAGVNRELLVLSHELSQGQYKRFGGSLLVLAEQTDALGKSFKFLSALGVVGTGVFGAVAVSLGLVAAGMYTAYSSAHDFNNMLAATNNFAGLTRDAFEGMATTLSGTTYLSLSGAKDLLSALGKSGRVSATDMESLGQTIAFVSKTSGVKIEEVTKEFLKLAESPSKTAQEIDKMMNVFTPAQLEMIDKLERTGHKYEAMQLASKLFDDYRNGPGKAAGDADISMWDRLAKGMAKANDELFKNLGLRQRSSKEQLSDLDSKIASTKESQKSGGIMGWVFSDVDANHLREDQAKRAALVAKIAKDDADASATETKNRIQREGKDAMAYFGTLKKNEELRNDAIAKVHEEAKKARLAGIDFSEAREADAVEQIRRRYTLRTASGGRTKVDPIPHQEYKTGVAELAGQMQEEEELYKTRSEKIKEYVADGVISVRDGITLEGNARKEELAAQLKDVDAKIAIAEKEKARTGGKQAGPDLANYTAQRNKLIQAQATANAAEERQMADYEKTQRKFVEDVEKNLRKDMSNRQTAADREHLKTRMSDADASRQSLQDAITDSFSLKRADASATIKDVDTLRKTIEALQDAEAAEHAQQTVISNQQQADSHDWSAGWNKAFANYRADAANTTKQGADAFASMSSSMTSAIETFATSGSFSFKSFASTVLASLAQIAAKSAASGIMGLLGNALGFGNKSISESSLPGFSAPALNPITFQADGGAWSKGTQFFADGGVVNRATSFGMSNGGTGVMGEAGPEAIMPLKRGADGKLGVAAGGNTSGGTTITFGDIIIQGGQTNDETASAVKDAMASQMARIADGRIANAANRPGGLLYKK